MNQPAGAVRTRIVALTGGIASGKTAVSDAFVALGVPVVDTDVIARRVVAPGSEGLQALVAEFGEEFLTEDGALDRNKLREIIFMESESRERLEAILHPRIAAEARRQIESLETPYAILVAPLLVETGVFEDADRVLVVDVPESVQIERLSYRDGASEEQARAALAAQASRQERLARADDVIENTGSLAGLQGKVRALDRKYRNLWGG